jgi:hypothetical protein
VLTMYLKFIPLVKFIFLSLSSCGWIFNLNSTHFKYISYSVLCYHPFRNQSHFRRSSLDSRPHSLMSVATRDSWALGKAYWRNLPWAPTFYS